MNRFRYFSDLLSLHGVVLSNAITNSFTSRIINIPALDLFMIAIQITVCNILICMNGEY